MPTKIKNKYIYIILYTNKIKIYIMFTQKSKKIPIKI